MSSKGMIICFGDSNTWGYEPLSGGRYPARARWVDILAKETGWTTVNAGLNGRQIPHTEYEMAEIRRILDVLDGAAQNAEGGGAASSAGRGAKVSAACAGDPDFDMEALRELCRQEQYEINEGQTIGQADSEAGGQNVKEPDRQDTSVLARPILFWILLGTNDIQMNYRFRAEQAAARMQALLLEMLDHPAAASGRVQIRVLGPANVEVGPWTDERSFREMSRLGGLYRQVCRELGVDFTDLWGAGIGLAADGDHFSPDGHRKAAEFLAELL